jgi:serine/threonine protein kinase/Tol biopolymer transport system component
MIVLKPVDPTNTDLRSYGNHSEVCGTVPPKMAVTIGSQLGSYEITALLGKGGFGEVYRARDKKLKREVAIKILPDELSGNPDRLTRFHREAEVLASLNHPNIAAIYDLAAQDQSQFLVLELVDGKTLAERIARGPIPVEEALNIAKQIAEALEAAHEKGVIHRDLKPANIKITPDGKVKVLDFGLAKIRESSSASNLSNSPTLMTAPTSNVILGTASYMSPEQAKGKEADRATDVWAFGCVLYEMLTGHQVFEGETVGEVLGGIFKSEPDWARVPTGIPADVRKLLRRCLQKDTNRRIRDARDVRIEIEEAINDPELLEPPSQATKRSRFGWIAATAFITVAFIAATWLYLSQRTVAAPEMRLEIDTPATVAPLEFALSPDGRYIVFVASGDGPQRLWLRSLAKADSQPMAGTEGADNPFWSPDSRSIGFFAAGKLKRIGVGGGSPQNLANVPIPRGGTWNSEGTIVFASATDPLFRISASGGEPQAVTRLDPPRQISHRFPHFLPDGHHFLFYSLGVVETSGIYLGSLDSSDTKRLASANGEAEYLAGMIAFVRQTTLLAQHLDLTRAELTGEPTIVADPVGSSNTGGGFSISADGLLAYRSGAGGLRQLRWYDRSGRSLGVAGESDSNNILYPELSPSGQHVALVRTVEGNIDIWLLDLVRGGLTRFTSDPATDTAPVWSPDGNQITFSSSRNAADNLYVKPANLGHDEDLLLETPNAKYAQDSSKNGFLLYSEVNPKTGRDLWAVPTTGTDRKSIAVANTPFEEMNGQFSPDGRWVAYQTSESGQFQIVVQSFPEPTGKWQVSTNGGSQPRWRADGNELYFIAPDGKMMAAAISSSGSNFSAALPVALFSTTLAPGAGVNKQEYIVSRDGRFLLDEQKDVSINNPITLILNWKPKDSK